ncbi:hypothetical protein SUGI_1105390 [Cryptomeria japonica]|nr:hypothetical protein SUGI_1105390 [Cryptomeria japonica]
MVGVFSQSSDPSEALLKNPGSSSLLKQDHHHQPLPSPDEPSPPSTVLIPSSSNSSLEVQSREQQQQTHQHQQPQAQDRPMTMGTDPQESGVRLVQMLMACAEAVQENRSIVAGKMVKDIRSMACNQGGAMGKVAKYFAEALTLRIYGSLPQDALLNHNDSVSEQLLHIHFYESCPYLKFAYFTANQAILEAFADHKRVHIIDFNLKQGMQWPALIQALALRPGGPPAFRLTGIGPRQPDGSDVLQEVGMKLAHLAESVNLEFSFRGYVVSNLSNLKPWMLDIKPGVEAVAVNSILQLHRLIDYDPSQPSSSIDQVLTIEALHYYSTIFDSLEACRLPPESEQQASMLLTLFPSGEGYRVEENNGCLTLGWHSRPLIAASPGNALPEFFILLSCTLAVFVT